MESEIKELLKNQAFIRSRLIKAWKENPISLNKLAKEIGTSPITLNKFLMEEIDIEIPTIFKILNYIEKKEKK